MGYSEGAARPSSVPPPGWTPSAADSAPQVQGVSRAAPAAAIAGADAAVRWRISAAIIDNLVVYGGYLALCAVLHWRVVSLDHVLVLLLGGVAYHFALEARDGQTIGKRQYGIRVVSVDGEPASSAAIAIRSVLRVVDQLPVLYVSGLVNMVRTGAARRQRIGDVAAGTTVVAFEGRAEAKGTPGWMLPAATIFAVLVSIACVYAVVEPGKQPLSTAEKAQFISSCQLTGGQFVDCGCALTQLEAEGYDTADGFAALASQLKTEVLTRQPGSASRTLAAAVVACRR